SLAQVVPLCAARKPSLITGSRSGMGMKFPDRRRTLRHRTTTSHAGLEAQIGPLHCREAYVTYARGLHAFRAVLEPAIARFVRVEICGDWRPVEIAPDLADDLADLNALPVDKKDFSLSSSDEAIGAMYVLEGSALGARVLVTHAKQLGFNDTF